MPVKAQGSNVIVTTDFLRFSGELLEDLRASHRFFIMVRDAARTELEGLPRNGDSLPGEQTLFAAGKEFVSVLQYHLEREVPGTVLSATEGRSSQLALAQFLGQIWPPDLSDAFDPEAGILDMREF